MAGNKEKVKAVIEIIRRASPPLAREIGVMIDSLRGEVEEVRLRRQGLSSLVTYGKEYPLYSTVGEGELDAILRRLCDDSMYAYRDSIMDGFVSMDGGIRVGVAGRASYDGGQGVGVGDFSSLVFRIPTAMLKPCHELYATWRSLGEESLLIASPPAGGKTTALRSLARMIGSGALHKRVTVVDERLEFDPSEYCDSTVDILRGYRRKDGIEIAVRTMSSEVVIVDEIYSDEDREALLFAHGSGVSVIATAHAKDMQDLKRRRALAELLDGGMFSLVAFIERRGSEFIYKMEKYA